MRHKLLTIMVTLAVLSLRAVGPCHCEEAAQQPTKQSQRLLRSLRSLAMTAGDFLCPTAYAADKGNAPVAHWRFDEGGGPTAYDDSANNNDGTLQPGDNTGSNDTAGEMWSTAGKINAALECDGTNDYVGSFSSQSPAGSFTVSAWVKDASSVAGGVFHAVYAAGGLNANEIWFGVEKGTNEFVRLHVGGSGDWVDTSTGSFTRNTWYHIAGTWDGTTAHIYIDGVDQSLSTTGTPNNAVATNFEIGRLYGSTTYNFWNGLIDDVRVYDYARTPAQIAVDYNAGMAAHIGEATDPNEGNAPVGYWPLNENTGTNVYDRSGSGNNGTITDATWTHGKYGAALNFDGFDSATKVVIGTDSVLEISGAITVEAWIKFDQNTTAYQGIVSKYWKYDLEMNNNSILIFRVATESPNTVQSPTALNAGQWYHVVGTYDPGGGTGNLKLYIDAELVDSDTTTGNITTSTQSLYIGSMDAGWEFDGLIDDVRIYNYARTQAQIAYDYSKGAPIAHYRFDEGTGTIAYNDASSADQGAAPVGWWRMDEASSGSADTATVTDESGNGNNGIADNGADNLGMSWTTGKIGLGALSFDGVDDQVSLPYASANGLAINEGTISLWTYWTGTAGWDNFVAMTTGDQRGYKLGINASGKLNFFGLNYPDGQSSYYAIYCTAPNAFPQNQWTHITVTFGGSTGEKTYLYIDGKKVAEYTAVADCLAPTSGDFDIGHSSGTGLGGGYFQGYIDDVRIYNYARTAEQIYNDYKSTHGTMVGDTKFVDGKIGKALSFDGTGDYVDCGTDEILEMGTSEWTAEAWIKISDTAQYKGILTTWSGGGYETSYRLVVYDWGGLGAANKVSFVIYHNTYEDAIAAISTTSVTDGVWHHVTGVRDSTSLKIYVDGVEEDSETFSSSYDIQNLASFKIGKAYSDGWDFNGLIDDVRIYNYARTAAQIMTDYNAGVAVYLGAPSAGVADPWGGALPVGHWKLDENTGVLARDASGNANDGTLGGDGAGTDVPTWTHGKKGAGLSFDGGDYVDCGTDASLDITDDVTVAAWIKLNSDYTSTQDIVGNVTSAGSNCSYHLDFGRTDNKFVWIQNGSSLDATSTGSISDNNWHHIVGVRSGSTGNWDIKFYIDGIFDSTTNTAVNPVSAQGNNAIGRSGDYDGHYFNGLIDDMRIYDYALTQAQVSWLYNKGKPVGYWRLDEATSGAVSTTAGAIKDDSDHNNDGTASNTTWSYTTGKFGGALSLDGNDYVDCGNGTSLNISSEITLQGWAKGNSFGTANTVVSKYQSPQNSYILRVDSSKLRMFVYVDGAWRVAESTTSLTSGQWYYLSGTYDSSTGIIKVYINGVEAGSTTLSGLTSYTITISSATVRVGATAAEYFDGQIDDVRIYNYARTAAQVMQDYNRGVASRLGD